MELWPLIGAVPAYHWRRRTRFHYARDEAKRTTAIGFYAPRSHRLVDVPACPQMEPAVADAYAAIRAELGPVLGSSGEIEVLAGHTGQAHVAITGWCSPRHPERLLGKGGDSGTIAGLVLRGPKPSGSGPRPRIKSRGPIQWGERRIELEPDLYGRADLFAQASRAGNDALLAAVERAAGSLEQKRVVEFFAGVGNLTRMFVQSAAEVVATDGRSVPWRHDLRLGPAHRVAGELVREGRQFDVAVLDPPRVGAADLMAPLAALGPERIVYISCDPATLARDIGLLERAGYRAETAQPLDLMPQTAHVEVVVTLTASMSAGGGCCTAPPGGRGSRGCRSGSC
jgi:23S rRNA (uracil1939-C5)-methyltransferase